MIIPENGGPEWVLPSVAKSNRSCPQRGRWHPLVPASFGTRILRQTLGFFYNHLHLLVTYDANTRRVPGGNIGQPGTKENEKKVKESGVSGERRK